MKSASDNAGASYFTPQSATAGLHDAVHMRTLGGVLLFDDQKIITRQPPHTLAVHAPQLATQLAASMQPYQRRQKVQEVLTSIGFDSFEYSVARMMSGTVEVLSSLTTYGKADWIHRYFSQRYHEIDPCLKRCLASGTPLVWDADDLAAWTERTPGLARMQAYLLDCEAFGVSSGVTYCWPAAEGRARVVVRFHSSNRNRRWISDAVIGQALALGMAVHEYLSAYDLVPSRPLPGDPNLSQVQQRILDCLIKGMTDREIAQLLELTTHNVDYHLRRLRALFGVTTRVQLVKAACYG